MSRVKCCDLVKNAVTWSATSIILTGALLSIGSVALLQTCYVPENDVSTIECASKTTTLMKNKFVLFALIAMATLILLFFYEILVAVGFTCDGMCNNVRHTVFITLIAGIASTAYTEYLVKTLDSVPTSTINNPDACLVCPNGRDHGRIFWLVRGCIVAWTGFVATLIICFQPSDERGDVLKEVMIEQDENDTNRQPRQIEMKQYK